MLRVTLLGAGAVELGGQPVPELAAPRPLSLIAHLVLHRSAAQPRAAVAFTLWPESTEQQARTNLRHLLHDLRRTTPDLDGIVDVRRRTLQWRPNAQAVVDVIEFEEAASLGSSGDPRLAVESLERAVAQYGGDLLPASWDDWVLEQRRRLKSHFVASLERLVDLAEHRGAHQTAATTLRRLLSVDPLDEGAYRRLMRSYAAAGQRARALRVFEECASMLRRELGAEPDPETVRLHRSLAHPPRAHSADEVEVEDPRGAAPTLVGRGAEWTRLLDAWRAAVDGRAHMVLVSGEAGIGKTRLVEDLAQAVVKDGADAAKVRSYEAEGRMAWGPIADLLRAPVLRARLDGLDDVWLGELTRLLPELRAGRPDLPALPPVTDATRRTFLFEAAGRAIYATSRPLLLVLDDLQWADRDTIEFLHYVVRLRPEGPLLLVGTARPEEIGDDHPLSALRAGLHHEGTLTEVPLSRLDAPATAELGRQLEGGPLSRSVADTLYRETEGNPLFVIEAVRAGLTDKPGKFLLSPTVKAVIQSRLGRLSEAARPMLELAAIVGRQFSLEVLISASGEDEEAVVSGLDELWQAGIIREHGHGYDFSHDKLRAVAQERVSPVRRRHLHKQVVSALERLHAEDLDDVSARLAVHYEAAGMPLPAIEAHRRSAARSMSIFALDDAIAMLTRALRLLEELRPCESRSELELRLLTELGVPMLAREGYGAPEVLSVYERAVSLSRRLGRQVSPPVLRGLAIAAVNCCRFERAMACGQELLEQAADDPMTAVEAHYVLGVTHFWIGRFHASRDHLEEALARYQPDLASTHLARFAQDPQAVCLARLGLTLWYLGRPDEASRLAERAVRAADTLGHPMTRGYALTYQAMLACHTRDLEALGAATAALTRCCKSEHLGFFGTQPPLMAGWLAVLQGRREGIEQIEDGVERSRVEGHSLHRTFGLSLLAAAHLRFGDPAAGLAAVDEGLAWTDERDQRYHGPELLRLRGELLAASGDEDAATLAMRQSLGAALGQGARSIALRAACSLARLTGDTGPLASVHGAFEQGHRTADLKEAAKHLI